MKKLNLIVCLMLMVFTINTASAQARRQRPVISPEIKSDSKITFRLMAPEAKTVKLTGNWMTGAGAQIELMKNDSGMFQATVEPLPSEMYTYTFSVDGVRTLDPSNPIIVRDGTRNESMFMVPGDKTNLYGVFDVPHGTLEIVWYPSSSLGLTRQMYVYTPPGYKESTGKFPVLYLLHGAGGDEDAWTTLGRTPQILDNLIASGKAKPMIVVMTNGNPGDAAAPGATPAKKAVTGQPAQGNAMGSGRFEESIVKDVIPFIEKNYKVAADKNNRAVAGLSMGGMQTLYLTNNYPEKFSYFGILSMGLMDNRQGGNNTSADDRMKGLEKLKASQPKLYWIGIGKDDFLYANAQSLRKFLDDNKFKYEYLETTGGHTWPNWRIYLSELAPKFFK